MPTQQIKKLDLRETEGQHVCRYVCVCVCVCVHIYTYILEMWVQFLDKEDPLQQETATQSSILALEISWTEDPGGLQSMELKESDTTL